MFTNSHLNCYNNI